MNDRKKIFSLIIILVLIITIGSTYSWLTWSSDNDKVLNITIGNVVNFEYTLSNEINTDSLAPVLDYTDGELLEFSLNKYNLDNNKINIYLYINNIDDELKNESFKYILLKENGNNNYSIISEGNFINAKNNEKLYILNNEDIGLNKNNYRLYIYIDGNLENNNKMMKKRFNTLMNIEIKKDEE